ncbi:peptide/nickel transport system substrate-binding protein [Arthrobacter pascens]|uniref:ABC transporter substrate-binding protein n=1 Tax=Arthrobacter pascens TaxID=1677 RepID=UPI00279003CD|nr:ABC transporter substrate-binding protein [Arthrobacter pascens]MDQ0680086.1 peptide/nickel transport system substrate-binding protein [Arthrobacter pascens]
MGWQRMRVAGASAVALLMIAGCAGAGKDTPAANQPLRVVGQFEFHSLDPSTAGGLFTRLEVAETLVDADSKGVLQPGLADNWTASADGLSWTLTLRSGALFHDGTEVTADVAAAALNTAHGKAGTPLATVPLKAISAEGNSVRVDLTEPFAPLPAVLAHTSTQILAPSSYGPDQAVTKVVGSGPYRVTQLEPPANIKLAAFEQWRGEKPEISEVTYQAVGRSESRALMAESAQSDVTFGMDPTSLQKIKQAGKLNIADVTLPRAILLKVNSGHDVLGDVQVRRAISMALDRESMATALLRDPEMAATQLFPPSLPDWHQESATPLEHDPSKAKELLADAGWVPGSDGTLERDGKKFSVTLRTFPDRPELPVLATAIQAKLKELGIALDVKVGNSSEIPAGHKDGSLELALYSRNYALVPDALVTLADDFAPEGGDYGAMGWNDPALTSAFDALASGHDADHAAESRRKVTDILQTQLPVIPVAWYRQSAVVSPRIEGLILDPLERSWRLSGLTWAK